MNGTTHLEQSRVLVLTTLLTLACAACGGGGLSGTYVPDGKSFGGALITSLNFTSSTKVEVTGMGGTQEVTYERDGNKIKLSETGDDKTATIMTIGDDGCLDAGGMLGKFCKK